MTNAFLIGSNIYLRPLERSDASLAAGWLNDPEVRPFLRQYRPLSLHVEEDYIDRMTRSEHDLTLVIVLRERDLPIGLTGLHQMDPKERHAQFGIVLGAKEHWGRGHGTEATRLLVRHAFKTLNLNRVWLNVYEYNPRALRCYEKAGFRKEGVLRQDHFHDGRYHDSILMGILREEWRE